MNFFTETDMILTKSVAAIHPATWHIEVGVFLQRILIKKGSMKIWLNWISRQEEDLLIDAKLLLT